MQKTAFSTALPPLMLQPLSFPPDYTAAPMSFERDNIRQLAPYVPGEQPQAGVVKLNTNENPYPPADAVLDAIRAVDGDSLRRYPTPRSEMFRQIAADVHGLSPEQVIATNGGDELLRLVFTVFTEPGDGGGGGGGGVGVTDPTYSLYPVLARIQDTALFAVPRNDEFGLPEDFADRLNDAGCRLAMIVNPHAPSGRIEMVDTLARVAEGFNGVLLIDEAYVDFAEHDALPLLHRGHENVILLRTLSKGYSLAGLRFGYGLSSPDLIEILDKARDSYNMDAIAQAAACAALTHRDVAAQSWSKVKDERTRVSEELNRRGFDVIPSQTNFILARASDDDAARTLYESLKQKNIFVRYFEQDRLRDKLRITIGTQQQNDQLLDAIDQLIG